MKHDDPEKDSLFLHYVPSQLCIHTFLAMIVVGYFKWQYQVHVYHLKRVLRKPIRWVLKTTHYWTNKKLSRAELRCILKSRVRRWLLRNLSRPMARKLSRKMLRRLAGFGHKRFFIRESTKALDCAAGALWVDCRHDETISNRAAAIWKEEGFKSPLWTISVKVVTEKMQDKHLELSAEVCRPILYEPPPKQQRKKS